MDRLWAGPVGDDGRTLRQPGDDRALPSRAAALGVLGAALRAQAGPVLVTGEAGTGKTWLCRALQDEAPGGWRWVTVDLTPATDPAELYRLIGHGLGLPGAGEAETSRVGLARFLQESSTDGGRWVLVVDEAQNAAPDVWEEVRVLGNRLGRSDGFAGLILLGQTSLARRLSTRPLSAVEARLSARVHLRPFDVEEARAFLRDRVSGLALADEALERFHRDTGGNPRRLFQLTTLLAPGPAPTPVPGAARPITAAGAVSRPVSEPTPTPTPIPASAVSTPAPAPQWEATVVGPARPPLEVGDGVVEVGWEPAAEPESSEEWVPAPEPATAPVPQAASAEAPVTAAETEETINDHYAALQAWTEWAKNQGRGPVIGAVSAPGLASVVSHLPDEEQDAPDDLPGHTSVWAEGQQGFAPYSQLFSRLKQTRDSL